MLHCYKPQLPYLSFLQCRTHTEKEIKKKKKKGSQQLDMITFYVAPFRSSKQPHAQQHWPTSKASTVPGLGYIYTK